MSVKIVEDIFGKAIDREQKEWDVKRFTFVNSKNNSSIQVTNLGATILTWNMPDSKGKVDDIVLGFDKPQDYIADGPYFGATVGRVANRISNGRFTLNGVVYQLTTHINSAFQLHGGYNAMDKHVWDVVEVSQEKGSVTFRYVSPEGDNGYPGKLTTTVVYKMNLEGSLQVNFYAQSDKPTPVNLTNHSYFNLAGHAAGSKEILEHNVEINADQITEYNENSIPTGKFTNVEGTRYDLRHCSRLGDKMGTEGFDNNFCVNLKNNETTKIAKVYHSNSGRWLEVFSNQPGVQFYTSNGLVTNGKNGVKYGKWDAFCLETQNYPDAVNHPHFPSPFINPGEVYSHEVIYKYGVQK